jgi:transcriptional regulator with XRE-family HTH domain
MLAERIRQLRTDRGLTQQELADTLGITQQAVGRWEKGLASPDTPTLPRLADLFGVSTDYLLGRTDKKNNPITIAASRSDDRTDDLPEQALKEIEQFKEFVRAKYGKKQNW